VAVLKKAASPHHDQRVRHQLTRRRGQGLAGPLTKQQSFALTEATLALASVTARWRLQAVPGSVVRPAISSLLSPRGLLMTAWRR
jgi:hypothetical protein